MTHFLRLQSISILLALLLLLNIQLLANSGRLSLWIGDTYIAVIAVIGFTSFALFAYILTHPLRSLPISNWNLLLYFLWIPYLALLTYGWIQVVPAPSEAAWPSPMIGLLMIALTMTFPLYVLMIHLIVRSKQPST